MRDGSGKGTLKESKVLSERGGQGSGKSHQRRRTVMNPFISKLEITIKWKRVAPGWYKSEDDRFEIYWVDEKPKKNSHYNIALDNVTFDSAELLREAKLWAEIAMREMPKTFGGNTP
jgi:hypothetical protein